MQIRASRSMIASVGFGLGWYHFPLRRDQIALEDGICTSSVCNMRFVPLTMYARFTGQIPSIYYHVVDVSTFRIPRYETLTAGCIR